MSARIKKKAHVLTALTKSDPRVRQAILLGFDKELLKCISECALNILKCNIPL